MPEDLQAEQIIPPHLCGPGAAPLTPTVSSPPTISSVTLALWWAPAQKFFHVELERVHALKAGRPGFDCWLHCWIWLGKQSPGQIVLWYSFILGPSCTVIGRPERWKEQRSSPEMNHAWNCYHPRARGSDRWGVSQSPGVGAPDRAESRVGAVATKGNI